MQRPSGRRPDQLREIDITRQFTRHAEGSVLVAFGHTQVICTASVEEGVPRSCVLCLFISESFVFYVF